MAGKTEKPKSSKASVNDTHVSDQDFPSLAGRRAVVIIHYVPKPTSALFRVDEPESKVEFPKRK